MILSSISQVETGCRPWSLVFGDHCLIVDLDSIVDALCDLENIGGMGMLVGIIVSGKIQLFKKAFSNDLTISH